MPTIVLNGKGFDAPAPAVTWGDLLRDIDGRLAGTSALVTDVRFDGVDEPAFRQPDTLAKPIEQVTMVEVMTGTAAHLLDWCLEEAVAAIGPLCAAAKSVGAGYRGHDVAAAHAGLNQFADGLSSLVGIVGATVLASHMERHDGGAGEARASAAVAELAAHIEGIITAQQAEDWVTLADLLEFDVQTCLERLAPVLDSLRETEAA